MAGLTLPRGTPGSTRRPDLAGTEAFTRRQWLAGTAAGAAGLLVPRRSRAGDGALSLLQISPRPQQLSAPLGAFDRLITPTELFFVRSHFGPPAEHPERPLRVHGLVEKPLALTPTQLRALPSRTLTTVLQCAGNGRRYMDPVVPGVPWDHGAMGQATFTGVPLGELLKARGLRPGATHVNLTGADDPPRPQTPAFIRSIPLERALHPDTLVAWEMNGRPLTLLHGAPLRLVVPGWAGDHWIKWLVGVEVAAAEHPGFWVQKAYRIPPQPVAPGTRVPPEQMHHVTTFPVKSIIARPSEGGVAPRGRQEVVGVAFSGTAGIRRVEVSVDGGATWANAQLEGRSAPGTWVVFRHGFNADTAGSFTAMARATAEDGEVQPRHPTWNPSGYHWNAWHTVRWSVA